MKIKCIKNLILNSNNFNSKENKLDEEVEVNGEYIVYGIHFTIEGLYYYICPKGCEDYPRAHLSDFFKIIDGRLSSFWRIRYFKNDMMLIFKEFFDDKMFYENLIDGCPNEVSIFEKYKKLMDSEFNDLIMQFARINNNCEVYFQNQYGVINFNNQETNLRLDKWYRIELKFTKLIEIGLNLFKINEQKYKILIENNRLILNFILIDIEEKIINDNYNITFIAGLGISRIRVNIEPALHNFEVGEFLTLKIPIGDVSIKIHDLI